MSGKAKAGCLLFIMLMLICCGGSAFGSDYYLLPEVIGTSDNPNIGSFVTRLQPGSATGNSQLLSVPLNLPINRPAILSAKVVKNILKDLLPGDFVLVGNYCVFIPRKIREENRELVPLWSEILSKAAAQHVIEGWAELSIKDNDMKKLVGMAASEINLTAGAGEDTLLLQHGVDSTEKIELILHQFIPVYTAKGPLQSGDSVRTSDFAVQYKEIEPAVNYLPAIPLSGNFIAARYIRTGAIITERDIKKEDLIRSGERITIIVKRYPIFMKLEGIAYGSGAKGDTIRVKPVRSDKNLYASILSNREVYIEDL